MPTSTLLHDLCTACAERTPLALALSERGCSYTYSSLHERVCGSSAQLLQQGLGRGDRVATWLDKRGEAVVALIAAAAAGGVAVPINPVLKPIQVVHVLRDSGTRCLVTSAERLGLLLPLLATCPELRAVLLVGNGSVPAELPPSLDVVRWDGNAAKLGRSGHRVIDTDPAAIFYTSGSTGAPKGVVVSHRNLVAGAASVAGYLGNTANDTLLAALPLSFDAGFSQLTTAFHVGARVVLHDVLLPRDVLRVMAAEGVTGLTAVPPLYIQLAALDWPAEIGENLRYFANTGGRLPRETLAALRQHVPRAKPFLMYGLTEAFRSTYLPPEEVDRRPDSIGKAIPGAEVLVLREDGTECAPGEPGELVHRGPTVALGYWGDAERTAERFRPLPPGVGGRAAALPLPEIAVFSGDTVVRDADGYLSFVGRRDEQIKTSGYRVSPTEVEDAVYATRLVGECAAYGVPHPQLGQVIHLAATPPAGGSLDVPALLAACRERLPAYMVPHAVRVLADALPRNPNGKIDRRALAARV